MIDDYEQEPWKLSVPQFVEELQCKRFGKTVPGTVLSVKERCRLEAACCQAAAFYPWTKWFRAKCL